MHTDKTLSETLADLGLTHQPSPRSGHRDILLGRTVLFTGSAIQAWSWLRKTGRIPSEVTP